MEDDEPSDAESLGSCDTDVSGFSSDEEGQLSDGFVVPDSQTECSSNSKTESAASLHSQPEPELPASLSLTRTTSTYGTQRVRAPYRLPRTGPTATTRGYSSTTDSASADAKSESSSSWTTPHKSIPESTVAEYKQSSSQYSNPSSSMVHRYLKCLGQDTECTPSTMPKRRALSEVTLPQPKSSESPKKQHEQTASSPGNLHLLQEQPERILAFNGTGSWSFSIQHLRSQLAAQQQAQSYDTQS